MNKKVGPKGRSAIETMQQFRGLIVNSLSKMKDGHTTQTGLEELREIMQIHVVSTERMNALISIFAEQNEHMGIIQRKEVVKLFGIMGEVFGVSLLPFIARILIVCFKKFDDPQMHNSISDSIGTLIHHVYKSITESEEKVSQFISITNIIFNSIRIQPKNIQIGSAMTLARVIQNCPIEALVGTLDTLCKTLLDLIPNPATKCTTQLLEVLVSLILAVEYEFAPHARKFIPTLLECMNSKVEWNIRKMAVDVIYTFAAFLPDTLVESIDIVTRALKELKTDKIKHVREAATEALSKIKEAKSKEGKALHESPPKSEVLSRGYEESKQPLKSDKMQKSIFDRQMNPNFIKAAPKSAIEIVTAANRHKEEIGLKKELGLEEDVSPEYSEPLKPEPEMEGKIVQDAIEESNQLPPIQKKIADEDKMESRILRVEEKKINKLPEPEAAILSPDEPPRQPVEKEVSPEDLAGNMPEQEKLDNSKKEEASIKVSAPAQMSNFAMTIQYDIDRLSKQQGRLMESLNSFQSMTRKEIELLQSRMTYIEELVEKIARSADRGRLTFSEHARPYEERARGKIEESKAKPVKKEESFWEKALEYIKEERYNDVYNWILGKKDDLLLIRLMGRTGIVIDKLDTQNIEFLIYKILDLISSGEFIDLLLAWIIAAIDKKVELSLNARSSILECLSVLLKPESTRTSRFDEWQQSEINRIYNALKISLSSMPD